MKGTIFGMLAGVLCAFFAYAVLFRSCAPKPQYVDPIIRSDTVIIRDTVRRPPPEPRVVAVVRRDTVRLPAVADPDVTPADSVRLPAVADPDVTPADSVRVEVPITQSVYKTDDYQATIEGYNARLVDMETYRQTAVITNEVPKVKSPRWALTVGPGVGYGPNGVQAYVGVSLGFVILSK